MKTVAEEVNEVIERGIVRGASDLHFLNREQHLVVYFRVQKQLIPMQWISSERYVQWVRYMKYVSGLNVSEERFPQSGAYALDYQSVRYPLRFSFIPASPFESAVIRIHYPLRQYTIEQLTWMPNVQRQLQRLTSIRSGLALFCGATGEGKTTTLYTLMHVFVKQQRRILSVEDPIEVPLSFVTQTEVNEEHGLTYDVCLRASLRHDPDVIIVGEIRDGATAQMCVRAAMTGHLVIATMHASTHMSAILRLQQFGVSRFDLSECLCTLSVQRLVFLPCNTCFSSPCAVWCLPFRRARVTILFELIEREALSELFLRQDGASSTYPSHVVKCSEQRVRHYAFTGDYYAIH
ncbi:MAG: ATPase, T2SS/T4P/T4SS family [Bacilli bacterium]